MVHLDFKVVSSQDLPSHDNKNSKRKGGHHEDLIAINSLEHKQNVNILHTLSFSSGLLVTILTLLSSLCLLFLS